MSKFALQNQRQVNTVELTTMPFAGICSTTELISYHIISQVACPNLPVNVVVGGCQHTNKVGDGCLPNSMSLSSQQTRIHFQLYPVATEFANLSWIRSSVAEQMPTKGMVVSSSLAGSVDFPTVLVSGQLTSTDATVFT